MKSDFFGNREKLQKGKTATHNPEVVGSNPSPATTKKTDFVKKSVFFCTFCSLLSAGGFDAGEYLGNTESWLFNENRS